MTPEILTNHHSVRTEEGGDSSTQPSYAPDHCWNPCRTNRGARPFRTTAGTPITGTSSSYVELPQICTGARKLKFEVTEGDGWVFVRQWFQYRDATDGREPGSLWEQTIVFRDGLRYFLSADTITSVNSVAQLTLRIDMPGT